MTNILIIITDQQSAHAMSCAGNPWLNTPNMDRLAARGVRFDRAYCSYPLCSPARGSQMTGRYPHRLGINGNEARFFWYHDNPRELFLGHHLAQSGYCCVWAGKDMPPSDGSRDFELLAPWGDAQAAERIAGFLGGEHDRPFCAVANFVDPHNICEYAHGGRLPEGDLPPEPPLAAMPPPPANLGVPPYEPELIREVQKRSLKAMVGDRFTVEDWRRYLWAYYRLVERVDAHVGTVLDALDAAGLTDDTLVWFCADHGDGCAAHAWNQKMLFYEEIIRVPTIVAGPGLRTGAVEDRLVAASLDLFPTVLEAAGLDVPSDIDGRSLIPLLRGEEVATWRDAVVVESGLTPEGEGAKPIPGRAVVGERWKYSAWADGRWREQLVDLAADPGEMVNLAVCEAHAGRVAGFRERLQGWKETVDDWFTVPGFEIMSPAGGREELGRIDAGTRWPWQAEGGA